MSHHHHHKVRVELGQECCPQMYGGYGMTAGYGGGYGVGYGGGGYAGGSIRWIYALLILIVIVLQFGRRDFTEFRQPVTTGCCDGETAAVGTGFGGFGLPFRNQLIDNSVLFIIVVFLLILCAGCWWGGGGGCGSGYGAGYGGGYGY
jgi:hypothetical protein